MKVYKVKGEGQNYILLYNVNVRHVSAYVQKSTISLNHSLFLKKTGSVQNSKNLGL